MKTLIITLEYPPHYGGVASYVYNLAAHLPPTDIAVYATLITGKAKAGQPDEWTVFRHRPFLRWLWPRWIRLFFQIWQIVRREKITQLYVHQVLPVGYVAYALKKIKKIPYTVFLHGTDINLASRPLKRRKFKWLCQAAAGIVVNSNFLKQKILERTESPPPVTVVYPCPGDQFFDPVRQDERDQLRTALALQGKKVLLSVARLVDGKGFPHLIRLLPYLLPHVPQLVCLIIGEGPKFSVLAKLVQELQLQNVVRFLGAVPYAQLPLYYQSADVFALLTHRDQEAEEGWGTVFLEAAASGLPVVAGRVGGVEEAVEHGRTGLVVDVYQQSLVVETLRDLFARPSYAAELGGAARARAAREFRWEKQITKFWPPAV